jgi:hypothetical protein
VQGKDAQGPTTVEGAPGKAVEKPVPTFKVDVQEMKSETLWKDKTDEMLADITAIFKKLHSTKAGFAIRGRPGFYGPIVDKLDALEEVCTIKPIVNVPTY